MTSIKLTQQVMLSSRVVETSGRWSSRQAPRHKLQFAETYKQIYQLTLCFHLAVNARF